MDVNGFCENSKKKKIGEGVGSGGVVRGDVSGKVKFL